MSETSSGSTGESQRDTVNAFPGGDTESLWMGTAGFPAYDPLDGDATADVCVIGAGWAGLSTAYHLVKAGRSVIVLDDGPVGGGESGRTTAHMTGAMDDRIYVLEHVHGEEGARLTVESHLAAVNRMEEIVRLEDIDCDFERVDGYLFLAPGDELDILTREKEAAMRAGFADVELLDRAPIADWESGPALRFPRQAQLHALRYLTGLAAAIVRHGGRIHSRTHVTSVQGGAPCTVETEGGARVRASAVCVCTNSPITDLVVTPAKMAPYRTYVIAARVPRGSVMPGLYWDTADPYHYVRLQRLDEEEGISKGETRWDALIVGGEDRKTGHHSNGADRFAALEEWMRQRWPQARDVTYRWSGQVLEPNDYLAYIGRNPDGAQNVYIATGDSGQGTTHGTIAGMLLTDLIMGRESPWAKLYDPHRLSLRAAPAEELARENIDVAVHYVKDYLSPGDVASADDIPRGEGRVVRRGLSKVAAFRDDSGTLHERSAVCTHLKCIVAWNSTEKTWDCPCHGSRFDPYGKVLNGPAMTDLPPAE